VVVGSTISDRPVRQGVVSMVAAVLNIQACEFFGQIRADAAASAVLTDRPARSIDAGAASQSK
jgi:hypothetical protein